MKHLALVGFAALLLTACPGPEGEGGSQLVGTWDELESPLADGDELGSVTFRDDGTFEIDDEEDRSGTFEVDGETLILTTDDSVEELPFATDGALFSPVGLRRTGGGDGFIGEWRAEGTSNGEPQDMELVLAADNTFTLELGEGVLTGSWRETGGSLITRVEVPDPDSGQILGLDIPWFSINDTITLVAYERR